MAMETPPHPNPNPKKKARKSEPSKQSLEPLEHISQIREKAGRRIKVKKEDVNLDIAQNVLEIRAILAMNTEIFDRCMGSMKTEKEHHCNDSDEEYDPKDSYPNVAFSRLSFETVRTAVYNAGNPRQTTTKFLTFQKRSEKSFDMGALLVPPRDLDDIIVVKRMNEPFSMFVDYDLVFEKSLLLHEDVLRPVLAKLKDHIMSVQVCLGSIDTWIMDPQKIMNFLGETFGEELKITDSPTICECPLGHHDPNDNCLDCGYAYSSHDGDGGACKYSYSYDERKFMCKRLCLLKECNDLSGKHEISFDITKENEQQKLKKFLEFLAMK